MLCPLRTRCPVPQPCSLDAGHGGDCVRKRQAVTGEVLAGFTPEGRALYEITLACGHVVTRSLGSDVPVPKMCDCEKGRTSAAAPVGSRPDKVPPQLRQRVLRLLADGAKTSSEIHTELRGPWTDRVITQALRTMRLEGQIGDTERRRGHLTYVALSPEAIAAE